MRSAAGGVGERGRQALDALAPDLLRRRGVEVGRVLRARVELALDPVEAGGEHRRGGEVRVGGAVDAAVLDARAARHADHLRAVVAAPGRVGRRPGGARVGRADADALVGVDRRGDDRGDRLGVMDEAGDEVVGVVGEPVAVRVARALEEVLLAGLVPEREVEVAAVAGQVPERLRHERRQLAALLRHDVDHVAEEDRAVAGDERVVVGEVGLELAVRVLVVVRVVAVAELVRVARERRQELVVAVQRLGVVAGLIARIERIVDDEHAVLVLAHEEELGLEAHLEAEAEIGGARDGVAQDGARAVQPRLALDGHVAGEAHELGLPGDARVRRGVGHGEHVRRGR